MNNSKRILFLLIFWCVTLSTLSAQDQEAEGMQSKAVGAFENADYSTAAYWLKLLQEQEGNFTDTRLQYMLVRSLYETQDYTKARIEAAAFFNLNPRRSSTAYKDVQRIANSLPNQLAQDSETFYKATETTDVSMLKEYLENYPNGKHRQEARDIIDDYYFDNARESVPDLKEYIMNFPNGRHLREAMKIIDDKTYRTALDENTPKALAAYLEEFPSGNHSGEAQVTLNGWEQAAYEQVKRTDTDSAYYYYLNNFPKGEHYNEIEILLETGKDDRYFRQVQQNAKPELYRKYLNEYPNGNHVEKAREYLSNAWIQLGDQAYDLENFNKAIVYYNNYLEDFPLGEEREYAIQQITRAEKRVKKSSKRNNRLNRFFIAYNFDTAAYLGISFGVMPQRKPGFYIAARSNLEVFETYRYEFNNAGASDISSVYDESFLTGNTKQQRAVATLGVTQRIIRPVWIYVGGGAQYTQTLYEVTEQENSRLIGTDYAINTDAEFLNWVIEGGIMLDIMGLHLRAGFTGVEASEWYPSFGVGFSFGYR